LSLPAIEPVPIYSVRVLGDGDDALIEVDPSPIPAIVAAPGQ
jgi:hypothetical protein